MGVSARDRVVALLLAWLSPAAAAQEKPPAPTPAPPVKQEALLQQWDDEARVHVAAQRIVDGTVRVDAAAVKAARAKGEYVTVRIDVRETILGPVEAEATFRHFVRSDDDPTQSDMRDADGLLALDGQERVAFLVVSAGGNYLVHGLRGQALVDPGDGRIVRIRRRELLHKQMLARQLPQSVMSRRAVRDLLVKLCQDAANQRQVFAQLEALGESSVVEIIAAMDDRRPLPERMLRLKNKNPDAFERERLYTPILVVDGIIGILNQITGEALGHVFNGGSDADRTAAVRAWTLYAHYLLAERERPRRR